MIDRAGTMSAHQLEQLLRVRAVQMLMQPCCIGRCRRHHAQVRSDDAVIAVAPTQGWDELGANLAKRSRDQNGS
jgi:hypothetical protein